MTVCGCSERQIGASASTSPSVVIDGQRVNRRLALAALIVASVLPTVLLIGVISYVQHELLLVNSQLLRAIDDCRCRHRIVSIDDLSQTASAVEVLQIIITTTMFMVLSS